MIIAFGYILSGIPIVYAWAVFRVLGLYCVVWTKIINLQSIYFILNLSSEKFETFMVEGHYIFRLLTQRETKSDIENACHNHNKVYCQKHNTTCKFQLSQFPTNSNYHWINNQQTYKSLDLPCSFLSQTLQFLYKLGSNTLSHNISLKPQQYILHPHNQ